MSELNYLACGRHVFVDISNASSDILNDLPALRCALTEAATTEGVTVLDVVGHAFKPSGVTVLLLLAESHVSLHTYPDQGKAFFDAFTCGEQFDPENIFFFFARLSSIKSYKITRCKRGGEIQLEERIDC